MRTAFACTLAAGAVIAGCGGSSAGVPLAAQDSATLRGDVSAIRAAADASNPAGAHAAVARLRADIQRLMQQGRLSPTDAQSMLAVSTQTESRISAEVHAPAPATTTVTSPSPTPAPKPAPPAHPKGPGKGGGKDHGHGGKDGGD